MFLARSLLSSLTDLRIASRVASSPYSSWRSPEATVGGACPGPGCGLYAETTNRSASAAAATPAAWPTVTSDFGGDVERRLADAGRDELPVDDYRVPLEQEHHADLVHPERHRADRGGDVTDVRCKTARPGPQLGELLLGWGNLLGREDGDQHRADRADRAYEECPEHPEGDAGRGGTVDQLLEHVKRKVRRHGAGADKHGLRQEAAASWDSGSLSEMKALYGSIAVLLEASSSQKNMKAIHSANTNGQRNRQIEQPIAPIRKYGFLRPHLPLHVRSLIAPMSGWIKRPVTGPARFKSGSCAGSAPRNW